MPVVTLNASFLKTGLVCPAPKSRIEWCCNEVPGLYVEVRSVSQGQGTYYLRYRSAKGTTAHQRLGRTKDITLSDARKMAKTFKAEIALGADPRGEEKTRKAVMTFGTFFEQVLTPYIKPRKRSYGRDLEMYKLRLKSEFGHLRLNEITRRHVQTFHGSLVEQHELAPATADHHVKLLRSALNRAVEWELLDKNPLSKIQLFSAFNEVENILNDEQMARLLHVLATDANRTVCLIALFLLTTGCRLNEALQARWSQINEETNMWRIPAKSTKAAKARSVPLNPSAVHVIQQLDTKGKFEYLFVNRQTKTRFVGIMKVWSRLRRAAGVPHLRLHDLRHGFASMLVSDGCSLLVVSQLLGHADCRVTMRYAHLSPKALQEAANSASVLIKPVRPIEAA